MYVIVPESYGRKIRARIPLSYRSELYAEYCIRAGCDTLFCARQKKQLRLKLRVPTAPEYIINSTYSIK